MGSASFYGADRLSEQLSDLYSEIATHRGIEFFDLLRYRFF